MTNVNSGTQDEGGVACLPGGMKVDDDVLLLMAEAQEGKQEYATSVKDSSGQCHTILCTFHWPKQVT